MAVRAQEEEKAILIILSLLIDVRLGLIQEKVIKTFVGLQLTERAWAARYSACLTLQLWRIYYLVSVVLFSLTLIHEILAELK